MRNWNNSQFYVSSQEYRILLDFIINIYSMFHLCRCTQGLLRSLNFNRSGVMQLLDLFLMHLINSWECKKCQIRFYTQMIFQRSVTQTQRAHSYDCVLLWDVAVMFWHVSADASCRSSLWCGAALPSEAAHSCDGGYIWTQHAHSESRSSWEGPVKLAPPSNTGSLRAAEQRDVTAVPRLADWSLLHSIKLQHSSHEEP